MLAFLLMCKLVSEVRIFWPVVLFLGELSTVLYVLRYLISVERKKRRKGSQEKSWWCSKCEDLVLNFKHSWRTEFGWISLFTPILLTQADTFVNILRKLSRVVEKPGLWMCRPSPSWGQRRYCPLKGDFQLLLKNWTLPYLLLADSWICSMWVIDVIGWCPQVNLNQYAGCVWVDVSSFPRRWNQAVLWSQAWVRILE